MEHENHHNQKYSDLRKTKKKKRKERKKYDYILIIPSILLYVLWMVYHQSFLYQQAQIKEHCIGKEKSDDCGSDDVLGLFRLLFHGILKVKKYQISSNGEIVAISRKMKPKKPRM